jgi:glucokinase
LGGIDSHDRLYVQSVGTYKREPMQKVFAGIDVGGSRIKVGLADQSGQLLSSAILETKDFVDTESFLEAVACKIEALAAKVSAAIAGAGMGCPGRVDFSSGRVLWLKSKLEFLNGIPLAERLHQRLGCPVACDNDVNAILIGEVRFGAGQARRDVVAITVGTGIGGAMMLGGNIVRGHNWATGHFGYMSHNPNGTRHVCGNTGIVEEYASQSGIQREIRRAIEAGTPSELTSAIAKGEDPGFTELFDAADHGDAFGRRLAKRMVVELGLLIANLIYALDPELVLVGGGIVSHRLDVLNAIVHEVQKRVEYLPQGATEILPMALGDVAGVLGAVALAMDLATGN